MGYRALSFRAIVRFQLAAKSEGRQIVRDHGKSEYMFANYLADPDFEDRSSSVECGLAPFVTDKGVCRLLREQI